MTGELGRYRLVRRLGEGGMGVVHLAEDETGRQVAIKVIRPHLADVPEFRARFRSEVALARRVARFCTAPILDADTEADQPYVVSEYVDGPTLSAAVADTGPLPGSQLHALGIGVAGALTAIHRAGIVHRDLKPSNVLLSRVGPRVIDFGIARAADVDAVTLTGQLIGSPSYMAPEQIRGEPVTPATDVFAWGALMTFAGTGRPPFGTSTDSLAYRVLHGDADLDGLDADLLDIVRTTLRKDPATRPTAQQLLDTLMRGAEPATASAVSAGTAGAVSAGAGSGGGRGLQGVWWRRGLVVGGVAAGIVAVVVAAALLAPAHERQAGKRPVAKPAAAVAPIRFDDWASGPATPVPGAKQGGTVTGLRAARWDHLDPQRAHERDAMSVGTALLYRTLTGYVDDGGGQLRLVGDLATDTGRTSDGGKTWTYTLRRGLRYEDGTAITAADVAYGIARTFAPEITRGPTELSSWLAAGTKWPGPYRAPGELPPGVTVSGATITFAFAEPHPEMPMVAALGTTAPVPAAKDLRGDYDRAIVASGPYRIDSNSAKRLELVRNQQWDPRTDPIRTAYPERWVFEFGVTDAIDRLLAGGETAFGWDSVPPDRIAGLPADARARTVDGTTPFNRFLAINTTTVTDVTIRRAIAAAINRKEALAVYRGASAGTVTGSLVSAVVPGHRPHEGLGVGVTGDPALARRLLDGRRPTLTYAAGTGPAEQRLAAYLSRALTDAGFTVRTSTVTGDYYRRIGDATSGYDLYLVAWGPDIPDASGIFPHLFSGAATGTNYAHFSEPSINQLIRGLQHQPDRASAARGYADLDERLLREHVPAVPFYDARQLSLHGAKLGGLSVHRVLGAIALDRAHVR